MTVLWWVHGVYYCAALPTYKIVVPILPSYITIILPRYLKLYWVNVVYYCAALPSYLPIKLHYLGILHNYTIA